MSIYTLYVKTHNKTGLKYLGFTKLDPFTYKGSGKYWNSHLKVHGNNVTTAILFQSQSKSDIKPIGLQYSKLWNIVESTEWANLKPEDGYGGYVPKHLRADRQGDKNSRYDSNIYTFYNLDTGKAVSSTRYNFYNTKEKLFIIFEYLKQAAVSLFTFKTRFKWANKSPIFCFSSFLLFKKNN